MRKPAVLLVALFALAAFPLMAQTVNYADNYHYQNNMSCSDCHSMHASAHNNLTDGSAIEAPFGGAAVGNVINGETYNRTTDVNPYYPTGNPVNGNPRLLKAADVCTSCHEDQTFAPDEVGDNVAGYIRSAGGLRAEAATLGGGHQLGSHNRPPGYDSTTVDFYPVASSTIGLECVNCHSPHGGVGFRNLVGYPWSNNATVTGNARPKVAKAAAWANTVTVPAAVPTADFADVYIANGDTYTFGTPANFVNYYGRAAVTYNRNATAYNYNGAHSSNRMDQFCGLCHTNFHGGDTTDAKIYDTASTHFTRHPTGIVLVGDAASATTWTNNKGATTLKVYQATGTVDRTTDSPGCLTCHKAHGNNNPFGLIYPDRVGGTIPDEQGGGVFKDLCKSCHSMGGA